MALKPADMQSCDKKKKCVGGPNNGLAYTPGDECPAGLWEFNEATCECDSTDPCVINSCPDDEYVKVGSCYLSSNPYNLMQINHRPNCDSTSGQLVTSSGVFSHTQTLYTQNRWYFRVYYISEASVIAGSTATDFKQYIISDPNIYPVTNCVVITPRTNETCLCTCSDETGPYVRFVGMYSVDGGAFVPYTSPWYFTGDGSRLSVAAGEGTSCINPPASYNFCGDPQFDVAGDWNTSATSERGPSSCTGTGGSIVINQWYGSSPIARATIYGGMDCAAPTGTQAVVDGAWESTDTP